MNFLRESSVGRAAGPTRNQSCWDRENINPGSRFRSSLRRAKKFVIVLANEERIVCGGEDIENSWDELGVRKFFAKDSQDFATTCLTTLPLASCCISVTRGRASESPQGAFVLNPGESWTHGNRETKSRSSSARRHLSSGRSEVSPVGYSKEELLQNAVVQLDRVIILKSKGEYDGSSTNPRFEEVKTLLQSNSSELGEVCEKVGGAVNSQMAGISQDVSSRECFQELVVVLKDVGQLHWVGAGFIILGIVWDRYIKANQYPDELFELTKRMRDLGRHILELYGQVKDPENPESPQTIPRAVKTICESAEFCCQAQKNLELEKSWCSFIKRAMLAETDLKKLESLRSEIDQIIGELPIIQGNELLRRGKKWPTPVLTKEDTELVGNEERVEEALGKLKTHDPRRVGALLLKGMIGIGKSTVGQHLQHQLKKDLNFLDRNCCMIDMRSGDDGLNLVEKQEELYSKLCRVNPLSFSNAKEGRGELSKLFTRLQDEPCLMYFVNVQKPDDLDQLLPDCLDTCLHPRSILLVTTVNEGAIFTLRKKGVVCYSYEEKELQPNHSKTLLLKKIFGDSSVSPDSAIQKYLMYNPKLLQLLDFCRGIPLIIAVVGSSIRTRGQNYLQKFFSEQALCRLSLDAAYEQLGLEEKKQFLEELRGGANHAFETLSYGDPISSDEVLLNRSLQLAFMQLGPDLETSRINQVFLNIVAVHLGHKWEDIELIWGAEHLNKLKSMSMIKRLVHKDESSGAVVHVHPLFIGAARRLDNTACSGYREVMENLVDADDDLPECFRSDRNCPGLQKLQVLKIDHCGEHLTAAQLDLVTSQLQYLEIIATSIRGNCKKLPKQLRHYRSRDSHLPFPFTRLQSLVSVDVDMNMAEEYDIDQVESMRSLRKLKLENSGSLKTLGPGLSELRSVTIESCPRFEDVRRLNPSVVEELKIADCNNFDDSSVTGLMKLKTLSLTVSERTEFSDNFVVPSGVQIVDFSRNKNLKVLPKFQPGIMMTKLTLRLCSSLERVDDLDAPRLEYLDLGGCSSLQRPPSLHTQFPRLRVLDVQGCVWSKAQLLELRQSVREMKALNPKFQVLGLRLEGEDEECVPRGCAGLGKRVTRLFRGDGVKAPKEKVAFKKCLTFPPREKKEKAAKKKASFKHCVTFPSRGMKEKYLSSVVLTQQDL
ncbi:hypothetical protein R1flu_013398 [Riccia fluitans]|uniref:NB-ARC domain-containing protein n=1 Tax=Riccia fluitans TaxID=41844 RepID=A0ABD1YD98_9MARC